LFLASNSDTDQPEVHFNKNVFYVVQWDKTNTISLVQQSAVFKAPQFTQINDICFIEKHQQYARGKIIFIGLLIHYSFVVFKSFLSDLFRIISRLQKIQINNEFNSYK